MTPVLTKTIISTDCCEDVEFEIIQPDQKTQSLLEQHDWIQSQINEMESIIDDRLITIESLSKDIDIYTADLDKWDYSLSVASGILCGFIDSFAVGAFDFDAARELVGQNMEDEIKNLAKKYGWEGITKGPRKGEFSLDSAIAYLEKNFGMPSDNLKNIFGGSRQHHLRDFAHHHSPLGLFFSILTQFTGKAYGTDTNGSFIVVPVDEEMIGKDLKRKYAIAVTTWVLHLASDMDGSNATAGAGCGVPGPLVSLIKVMSSLPIFNRKNNKPGDNKLSLFAAKLYNGTLLASRDENNKLVPVKIDLRGEMAIKHELGRQALPVILNDVFVRVFYLLRRLYIELKNTQITSWDDVANLNWRKIVPVANGSIARMMTIASGTFITIDLADAAIRGAVLSGGSPANFAKEMLLRINFVGIGRFAIAIVTDVSMVSKRDRLREERIDVTKQLLLASSAKLFYKQADMWTMAQQAEDSIKDLYDFAYKSSPFVYSFVCEVGRDFQNLPQTMADMEKHNPQLAEFIRQTFK